MEVHHAKVEKKNFKEYFFEFIMIFIAVTLGFFAENLREHISHRHKEKEYIHSLIQDIEKDTSKINSVVKQIDYRNKGTDTYLHILMDARTILKIKPLI